MVGPVLGASDDAALGAALGCPAAADAEAPEDGDGDSSDSQATSTMETTSMGAMKRRM
jgi:hypothetical protein